MLLSALRILALGAEAQTLLDPAEWVSRADWEDQNARKMTNWHARLREHLIGNGSGYDLNSPPISNRSQYADPNLTPYSFAATTSDAGTDVQLQLRVLKLDQIDISSGSMTVKVWLRLRWQDQRLKWSPADFGNLHTVRFWAHHPTGNDDGSEIWVPDITAYNTRAPMADQVEGAWVEVSSDGSVFFSRPGNLDILCKFQGLVKFPFDKDVRCDLDMGGWMTGGSAQGIYLKPGATPGVEFLSAVDQPDHDKASTYQVAAERSTGSTYVQYALTKVTANASYVQYDCCPNDPYPVMTFTFHLYRTTQMQSVLLVPLGFLTFLVNFAFFMECDDTNRVVYCMTILLIVMVVKDMTYSLVPLTGEIMWIHIYLGFCEFFAMMVTVQSFAVFFLSKYKRAFLMPSLLMVYIWLTTKRCRRAVHAAGGRERSSSVVYKKEIRSTDLLEDDMMHHQSALWFNNKKVDVETDEKVPVDGRLSLPERLLKWEKIFYQMDQELRGYLTDEDVVALFTFIRLDLSHDQIKKDFEEVCAEPEVSSDHDHMVVLSEFLAISERLIKCSAALVDAGVENFMSSRDMIQTRHNRRWRLVAARVDEWCRLWIPIFYISSLILIFNLSTDDGYGPDENGVVLSRGIYIGLPPTIGVEGGAMGWARILALPVIVLLGTPIVFCARQLLVVSLTKDSGGRLINKHFGLKPNYGWVDPKSSWAWLVSTAHQVEHQVGDPETGGPAANPAENADDKGIEAVGKQKYGPRYTAAELDRLIGYKICPDQRTKQVETHKTVKMKRPKSSRRDARVEDSSNGETAAPP